MKKLFESFKRASWTDHIIQFFIVLLSITIAFNLESYRQKVNNRKEELINLNNLQEELQKDIYYFEGVINHYTQQQKYVQSFLDKQVLSVPMNDEEFNKLTGVNIEDKFLPMDITYTSLVNSGKLSSMQNHDIRVKVIELYHRTYKLVTDKEREFAGTSKMIRNMEHDVFNWNKKTKQYVFEYPHFNTYLDQKKLNCKNVLENYRYFKKVCEDLRDLIRAEIEG